MIRALLATGLALAALLAGAPAQADVPVPPLRARVTDLTGTLSAAQQAALEARIAAWESKRGSQLAVLVLPSTRPEEIEQYAIRVAEAWKIGRKGVDDGLLLVVAKEDRRLRIEVGYGLEGAIPDAVAKRVIEETITPRFRDGDFHAGIRDGVDRLIRLAEGEPLPPPAVREDELERAFEYVVPFLVFVVLGGGILKAFLGRFLGAVVTGGALGVVAWLLIGVAAGVLAAMLGFLFAFANTGAGRGGAWSGGSSGGSSSSSGGFGGGGGSFGGGGASGRW